MLEFLINLIPNSQRKLLDGKSPIDFLCSGLLPKCI
jgi:hypothetical protein